MEHVEIKRVTRIREINSCLSREIRSDSQVVWRKVVGKKSVSSLSLSLLSTFHPSEREIRMIAVRTITCWTWKLEFLANGEPSGQREFVQYLLARNEKGRTKWWTVYSQLLFIDPSRSNRSCSIAVDFKRISNSKRNGQKVGSIFYPFDTRRFDILFYFSRPGLA